MGKKILYGKDARNALLLGIDALADAVSTTLGPAGRNAVIYSRHDSPSSSRDGVTVAKAIGLDELAQDAGCQIIKAVASKTADEAGDGTTTATILARSIYKEGLAAVEGKKANPVVIRRGIDKAVGHICGKGGRLDAISKPIHGDMVEQVAAVSANNDPVLGGIIAAAIRNATTSGVITVEESKTLDTYVETVEGMQVGAGWISPYFITDPGRQEAVLIEPHVLLCEQRIGSMQLLIPLFEAVQKSGRPILVLAEDVEGEVLPLLVVNHIQGRLSCCAVKAPGPGPFRKDLLNDISALTGGKAIISDLGMKQECFKYTDLGRAEKVIVGKDKTTIIAHGNKAAVDARISLIRAQLDTETSEYQRDRLQERLAKLVGGVAIIKVGAGSDVELIEKKARLEDALHATRAAIDEGIVPGGGVALARLSGELPGLELEGDEAVGRDIVAKAMLEPLKCIVSNAGEDGGEILREVLASDQPDFGYNALTGRFCGMVSGGIIDPTKVVRITLQNAGSAAGQLLLTETLIVEDEKRDKGKPGLPGRQP